MFNHLNISLHPHYSSIFSHTSSSYYNCPLPRIHLKHHTHLAHLTHPHTSNISRTSHWCCFTHTHTPHTRHAPRTTLLHPHTSLILLISRAQCQLSRQVSIDHTNQVFYKPERLLWVEFTAWQVIATHWRPSICDAMPSSLTSQKWNTPVATS